MQGYQPSNQREEKLLIVTENQIQIKAYSVLADKIVISL